MRDTATAYVIINGKRIIIWKSGAYRVN